MTSFPASLRILPSLLLLGLAACSDSSAPEAGPAAATAAELQLRIAALDRSIESAEALRAVKRLQWAYGHYSEFGLWHDFADLFADTGIGHYTQGNLDREGIRALFLDQVGQGQLGLATGRIYPHISFAPVLTLAEDGGRIEGRFRILAMLGGYGGNALWFHGVYENAYVQERGVWKIDEVTNAAQVSGTFTAGLSTSLSGTPALAFHYTPDAVGRAVREAPGELANPAAAGGSGNATDESQLAATLTDLERRLDRLDDEAAVVEIQHALGYLFESRAWDEVVALFAEQGRFEPGLQGVYVGRESIRQALDQFGGSPLPAGEIEDLLLFQTYVSVAPDGRSARARVDELGLHGNPAVSAEWTQGIYENRFVKENGEWRVESLHYYPRLITDYAKGWGADAKAAPGPSEQAPPDEPPSEQYGVYPEFHIPAFHFAHPVTGRAPQYPDGDPAAARSVGFEEWELDDAAGSGAVADRGTDIATLESSVAAAEARAQRALAVDAVENLISAYAFYLDECMTLEAAALFAEGGEVRIGGGDDARANKDIANALEAAYCPATRQAGEVTLHHVAQPGIAIASDGATARFSAQLWEIDVSSGSADDYRGGRLTGEARYEAGQWKLTLMMSRYDWTAAVPIP
jgi:hypothetical protein